MKIACSGHTHSSYDEFEVCIAAPAVTAEQIEWAGVAHRANCETESEWFAARDAQTSEKRAAWIRNNPRPELLIF